MSKYTEWATGNPPTTGVWQTKDIDDREVYQNWNGRFWGYFCKSPERAYYNAEYKSMRQGPLWRGLAEKPA